jgi:cobalt-zinc-cadmium efflux system outer membrane protein
MASWVLLLAGRLPAAEPASPAPLTLERALALAEQRNPALAAQFESIESGRAGEVTAGLAPNPTIQNDTTSATVGVTQDIEIGGKRRRRIESAQLATAIARTDFADARRALLRDVRQTFVGVLLAKADEDLARANLASFREVVDLNRLRLEKGALSGSDFLKIQLQRLQFETDLADAALARKTSQSALRTLLGGSSLPEDFEVEGNLEAPTLRRSLPELRDLALANRPDLKSSDTAVEKAAADVDLAKANRYPDPTVGVSFLHTGNEMGGPAWFQPFYPKGETSNAMGLGVSFPLPLFNRNQGEIARTDSEHRRALLLARAARDRILEEVDIAYAELQSRLERVRVYDRDGLPQANDSREIARYAYAKGATSLLDFLDAERTYRAAQLALRHELAGCAIALADLEAAVGAPVTP